jgi:hypothetical protein
MIYTYIYIEREGLFLATVNSLVEVALRKTGGHCHSSLIWIVPVTTLSTLINFPKVKLQSSVIPVLFLN